MKRSPYHSDLPSPVKAARVGKMGSDPNSALFDSDSGSTTTFDGKVKIEILTKDLCCDCIS